MKRARATMAARNGRGKDRIHVGTGTPVLVGIHKLESDLVLEHMRRCVDLHVHRRQSALRTAVLSGPST